MTDTKKKSETKADSDAADETKPKTASRKKAAKKAGPKANPKAEPKSEAAAATETTGKTTTADTAPYIKKESTATSSVAKPAKKNSIVPLAILAVTVITVLVTIYKFKQEHGNAPVEQDIQADLQKSSVNTGTAPASPAMMPQAETPMQAMSEQSTPEAEENTQEQISVQNPEQSREQAMAPNATYEDMMRQRREAYKEEVQSRRQQYDAAMEARQGDWGTTSVTHSDEFLEYKQRQLETREKIQALHEQISDLHKQIHQLIRESHERN